MDYRYGIETIDVLIDSLEQTKQQLKTNDLLSLQLYDNFDILSLIYQSMIELYGEEALDDFQNFYIKNVIQIIQEKIKADAVFLSTEYDDGFAVIKGSINYKGRMNELFYLNPYFKSIILVDNVEIDELNNQLDELYEKEQAILNRLEELQMAKINPIYYAKDDSILLAKMTVQKKKYERIIQEEIEENNSTLRSIKSEIAEIKTEIQDENNLTLELYNYRDRYLDRLKKTFNFTIVRQETLNQYNEHTNTPTMDRFSLED